MAKIGPHEGNELALMLNGQKQIALFFADMPIPDGFFPYLQTGEFQLKQKHEKIAENLERGYSIIYRQSVSEQVERLEHLLTIGRDQFIADVEREIGKLLGYTQQDIEFYIKRCEQRLGCP